MFYTFAPIADSLSLTSQSFVPPIAEKRPSKERDRALQKTLVNFSKVGVIFGLILSGAVVCIPLISRFATSDPMVISLVKTVVPFVIGVCSVHAFVCAFEGFLLGRKDLAFVGKMYAAWFFIVPYFVLRVKKAALSGSHTVGLSSVWRVFLAYQFFRSMTWTVRVWILQRRTTREAESF